MPVRNANRELNRGIACHTICPFFNESLPTSYHGYGHTTIDRRAVAYYRYERIIQDIAAFCQQIYATAGGDADRAQAFHYLIGNFDPGGVLDLAYRAERAVAHQQQEHRR